MDLVGLMEQQKLIMIDFVSKQEDNLKHYYQHLILQDAVMKMNVIVMDAKEGKLVKLHLISYFYNL